MQLIFILNYLLVMIYYNQVSFFDEMNNTINFYIK